MGQLSGSQDNRSPSITVLLVVRNEVRHIERCLRAVLDQTLPADQYEVLIIDGMSTDGTRDTIARLIRENPDRSIRLLDNPGRILATGWNIGLNNGRGTYVVRPEGHGLIPPEFLEVSLRVMEGHPEAAAVGGRWETVGEGLWGSVIAAALSSRFGVGGSRFRVGGGAGPCDTVPTGFYRRQSLLDVGGFDEDLGRNQDITCHAKLKAGGAVLYFDPSIESTYFCRSSLGALARQMFHTAFWLLPVFRRGARHAFSIRYVVPGAFVITLVSLGLAGVRWRMAWIALVAIIGVYLLAGLVAAMRTTLPFGRRFMVPVAFFVAHVWSTAERYRRSATDTGRVRNCRIGAHGQGSFTLGQGPSGR